MIKKAGGLSLLMVLVLFTGFMIGLFIGRSSTGSTVSLSAYDRMYYATEATAKTTDGRININTASLIELTSLPGIGEVLAQNIVQYRQEHGPFESIDALLQVDGIGQIRLKAISDYITVGG